MKNIEDFSVMKSIEKKEKMDRRVLFATSLSPCELQSQKKIGSAKTRVTVAGITKKKSKNFRC